MDSSNKSEGETENSIAIKELTKKIEQLHAENQKIQNEFNLQRAKLKELFIQKEADYSKCIKDKEMLQCELDELKSQFVVANLKCENEQRLKEMKAHEEISSLQQMVQDTIEESATYKAELERIGRENNRLLSENRTLRETNAQQQDVVSLTPQVLNHMKKTLVRKLGVGELSSLAGVSHESVEESSLDKDSSKDLVNEDAEVLSSIVLQLQDEMKVIKEKLREADEKLQANEEAAKSSSQKIVDIPDGNDLVEDSETNDCCKKCQNCSNMFEKVQNECVEEKKKSKSFEENIAELNENLQKEATLRKGLEDQWQEKRELHKNEVQMLRDQVTKASNELLNLQQSFAEMKEDTLRQIHRVIEGRDVINKHLEIVQADNNFLSGCYLATAEEIESQYINLPNSVIELQELILKQQNVLIQARVCTEYEKRKCVTMLDEIELLKNQVNAVSTDRRNIKKQMQTEIKSLRDQLANLATKLDECETGKITLERKEAESNRRVSELRVENIELQEANENLKRANADCKGKIKNLQDDLATSEQVQKDFVTLSQSLQMSLERLRGADKEVRWQDDDDIDVCPSCSTHFTVTVRKIHCRHCGHIYCDKCLTKTVHSGPRKRKARVCDICHTLLSPNTAPYFSHEPM